MGGSNRTARRNQSALIAVPCKIASYSIAHTVAVKMIYPGSVQLVNWVMSQFCIFKNKNFQKFLQSIKIIFYHRRNAFAR